MSATRATPIKKVEIDGKLIQEIKERLERGETPEEIAEIIGSRRPPRGKVPEDQIGDIRSRLERGEKPQHVAEATGVGIAKVYEERRILRALGAARAASEPPA